LPSDQEHLLEYSWAQLFVFTAAEWAFPISEGYKNTAIREYFKKYYLFSILVQRSWWEIQWRRLAAIKTCWNRLGRCELLSPAVPATDWTGRNSRV
jgi:hypothetical protein